MMSGHRGGKRGRGFGNKTPFVAAVSVDDDGHPVRMNMHVIKGVRSTEIKKWGQSHLQPGTQVISDGLDCFSAVSKTGCGHISVVTEGGAASMVLETFTWINTMIGNVKNAMPEFSMQSITSTCLVIWPSSVIVSTGVLISDRWCSALVLLRPGHHPCR